MLTLARKEMKGKSKETTLIASASKAKKFKPNKSNCMKRKAPNTKPSRTDTVKDKKNKGATADKEKCFHCNKESHWKRSCVEYVKTLKGKAIDSVHNSSTSETVF
ncbi:hypothetical protein ACH5RR_029468 [Cinchona calisaya]|uniref:CCHC-type domain-containing protein n=1 Tax=Cinchona calisaya TaxID=153742 RepID=A0ABD2YV21_9GENT